MPNHRTHEKINIAVLIILLILIAPLTNIATAIVFTVAFILCTFYITPDLDINSKPYRRWKLLRIIWWPYKRMFKHRGLSHNPIFGPLSLIGYIIIIPIIITIFFRLEYYFLIVFIIGMLIAIETHILSDRF